MEVCILARPFTGIKEVKGSLATLTNLWAHISDDHLPYVLVWHSGT